MPLTSEGNCKPPIGDVAERLSMAKRNVVKLYVGNRYTAEADPAYGFSSNREKIRNLVLKKGDK